YVETVFQEIGSPSHFVRFPSNKKNEVFHIKAGKYYISMLAASEVVLNTEARDPQFDINSSIPVMPIEIKAGEVIYLGTLVANGILHDSIMTRKNDIVTFEVHNESDSAKSELGIIYPEFADKMQIRLFELVD
ncbi:MAG: hypothetical protein JKY84_00995, partial [Emcibacteraceae bacterium]|nr:hypothetical protein [Emcibacteraceae bacterium]